MKFKLQILFCLFSFSITCQSIAQENKLIAPHDWRSEEIKLPLSFAPNIPIEGVELVQFAPGWGKPETEEYFTYTFAWFLEAQKDFNENDLESFLIAYFDGLMTLVGDFDKVGTSVNLKREGDKFQGTLTSKDGFFTKSELKLNLTIEKSNQGSVWLFRLSPQEWDHVVWDKLRDEIRIKVN